jgi:hypothetical protein
MCLFRYMQSSIITLQNQNRLTSSRKKLKTNKGVNIIENDGDIIAQIINYIDKLRTVIHYLKILLIFRFPNE